MEKTVKEAPKGNDVESRSERLLALGLLLALGAGSLAMTWEVLEKVCHVVVKMESEMKQGRMLLPSGRSSIVVPVMRLEP